MYRLDWSVVWRNSDLLVEGLAVTLELSLVALVFSVLIGIVAAYARLSSHPAVSGAAAAYVESVRNIPLLLIMFFVYFGLPAFAVTLTERLSAVLALSLYSGAYMTEIFRAGILAIGRGQIEAGQALGMTGFQISRSVVLPQAFRVVLPSLGNQLISLIKDSSLAVAISVRELTYAAVRINDISWRIVEVYSVIAAIYLGVTYTVALGLRVVERELRKRT
ncbi:MAG: amino acid ABC transporter permease [Chloroflexi bacterium]|nr:amino acid ABC transporter permease [Chloroflexota bacterium]